MFQNSLEAINTTEAKDLLKAFFEQCKTDGLFPSYSFSRTFVKKSEAMSDRQADMYFQVTVKQDKLGEQFINRAILFANDHSCYMSFEECADEVKGISLSYATFRATVTASNELA